MRFKSGSDFLKSLVSEYCPDPSVSNSVRLAHYFTKANNLYYQAVEFAKKGNDSRAYVELMRFSQLALQIQKHNSYKEKTYQSERNLNSRRLNNAILKLEDLKPKIINEYDNQIELEKQGKLFNNNNNNNDSHSNNDNNDNSDNTNEQKADSNNSNANGTATTNDQKEDNDEKKQSSDKSNLPSNKRWNNLLIPNVSIDPNNTNSDSNNDNNNNNNNNKSKFGGFAKSLDNIFNAPKKSTIFIPSDTIDQFKKVAQANTNKDIETCGVLCGKYKEGADGNDSYIITNVIIPKQKGSANTVQTLHEEELIAIQEKYGIIQLGWIHTHPSQTCFLSSVDMHCQLSYQIMMPNGIAIVHAPTDTTQVFTLTQKGIDILSKCNCQGFHRHENVRGLYEVAKHVKYINNASTKFIDLRL